MGAVRRLLVLVVALIVLGAIPASAQAAPQLDQQHVRTTEPGVFFAVVNDQSLAQTFTALPEAPAGVTATLDEVDLVLVRTDPEAAAPIMVDIREVDAAGVPSGPALATATRPAEAIPVEPAFTKFTFATPPTIVAGTRYAIVAYTSEERLLYLWDADPNDFYSRGAAFQGEGSPAGPWAEVPTTDFQFRTWVTLAVYAVPVSVERLAVWRSRITFRLIAPARVRFTLERRVSTKRYRRAGSFEYQGRRGRNSVRIPRRLNGRRVTKGVYRISARSLTSVGSGPVARRVFRLR